MVELKSKASAQGDLRHCLRGIPALCWADFDGKLLAEILDELGRNTRDYSHPKLQSLRNKTKRELERPDRTPTHPRFLATWLSQDRDYVDDWIRKALRNRSLGGIARWHARDCGPPSSEASDVAWAAWAESIAATLWPTTQDLQQALSPEQLAFREAILRIEVVKVTPGCVRWHIPSLDVNSEREVPQNALALDHLFRQWTERPRTATHIHIATGNGGDPATPGSEELPKVGNSIRAQNEPVTQNQQLRSAIVESPRKTTTTSDRPALKSQSLHERQYFRAASLAPPNTTAPSQPLSSSSEPPHILPTLPTHPDARVSQPVSEPIGTQFQIEVATSATSRAGVSKTPLRQLPGPFQVQISDSAWGTIPRKS